MSSTTTEAFTGATSAARASAPKTKLEHALEHAARSWRVFPLQANSKVPAFDNGHLSATTDPETIRAWWTRPAYRLHAGLQHRRAAGSRAMGGGGTWTPSTV